MARKKKNNDEGGGEASWMVTFSDLSTLLLTFFVLLLSMSSLNERAVRSSFHNFDKTSGILFFKNREKVTLRRDMIIRDLCKSLESIHVMDVRDLNNLKGAYSKEEFKLLVSSGNGIFFKKRWAPGDFSFVFGSQLLFESGSAKLKPKAYAIIQKVGDFLKDSPYQAFIDGHTDDRPIEHGPFSSNDELSLARAMAVARVLLTHCKVPPRKIAVGGYGSTQPMADNETPEGRALNRRVEIILQKIE